MKISKIRLIAIIALFAVIVSSFAGCGGSNKAPATETPNTGAVSSPGNETAGGKKVLRLGVQAWMLEKFQINEAADKFMQDHPDVKVEISTVELADTTSYVLQWSSGKTNVDLVLGGSREQAVAYVAKDLIIDFENGFFDDNIKKEDFVPAVFELGNIEGTQYMIPLMGEVYYLVVRKDLMEQAGLLDANGKPIPPKTWDELYDYAEKLTIKNGDIVEQTGLGIDWGNDFMHYTYMGCLQSLRGNIYDGNTNILDFKSDEAKYMLNMWAKLVRDKYAPIDTFADTNAVRTNFKAGKVAMHLTVHSRWPEYGDLLGYDKVTIMPLPGMEQNGSLTFIHGMVIPKASPEQELAKLFIKERLLDREFQAWTMNKFGKMPTLIRNMDGADAPEWKEIQQAAIKATNAPLYKDWAKLQTNMIAEIQKAITNQVSADEALKNLDKSVRSIDTTTGLK